MADEIIDVPDSEYVPPGLIRTGLNFLAAASRYVAAGCPSVTAEQYRLRVKSCGACPLCRNAKCLLCNCYVEQKAQMATEKCPRDPPLWPGWCP